MVNYYDNRKIASQKLRQLLASKPVTIEEMVRFVDIEFGFSKKFVHDWIEKYFDMLEEDKLTGKYRWKL